MQILGLLSDLLLLGATAGIALWCRHLAKRLRAFDDVDTGLGGTIAALSKQVAALEASLAASRDAATQEAQTRAAGIDEAVARADDRIGRMEMLLTSLETLEEEAADRLLHDPYGTAQPTHAHEPEEFEPGFRASRGQFSGQTRSFR